MARNFDREWSTGYWDYMRGLSHVSRYGLLASLACYGRHGARVLDVGCGEGTLYEHLGERVASYVGFDTSAAAIARASQRFPGGRAKFSVASVTDFQSDERFDVILFNAILYLFDDKLPIVRRYAQMLAPGGALVIENHTTFKDARRYFQRIAELQDASPEGWSKNHEVVPFDWLGQLFRDYQHQAHYTLLNWSVDRAEFPCRHVHVFTERPRAEKEAQEAEYQRPPVVDAGGRGGFHADSAPYLFGTETMGGVLEGLEVRGKSVLTVLGSSDQLLNFTWAGAREVVGFDISRAASYVCELKMAALRAYERKRYLPLILELQAGLGAEGKSAIARLLPQLSPTAASYWQNVLERGGKYTIRARSPAALQKINPYLQSDEAYQQTRHNLRDGMLYTADVFRVAERVDRKFDLVYLANVLDFNRSKAAMAVERLWPLVEPDGSIVSYEFASHKQQEGEYGGVQLARRQFDGVIYGGRDSAAVLRRWASAPSKEGDAERTELEQLLKNGELAGLAQMVPAGAQSSFFYRGAVDGRQLVLRAPRPGTAVDVNASFRSHRLVRELARRIGVPHLALPVALIETPAQLQKDVPSERMIAMPLLDASYRPAESVAREDLERISEDDRLAAALLCVITAQCDAVPKNALVTKAGQMVLVDLDTCLGRNVYWHGGASRPCFLPGGTIAYRSAQRRIDDLPPQSAALIRGAAEMSPGAAEAEFDLLHAEAQVLVTRARSIRDDGLSEAAHRHHPATK